MSVRARSEISRGVLVVMGAQCVGKSTLLRPTCPGLEIKIEIAAIETPETNQIIEQALVSGRNVVVEFVLCNDPGLLVKRMVDRATSAAETKESAIVHRLNEMAKCYTNFPEEAKSLRRQFDASVEFVAIDNSGRFNEAVFHVDSDASPLVCGIVRAQFEYFRALG